MNMLYLKACGLVGAVAALPLAELEILHYLKGMEFRALLAQEVITPLLSQLTGVALQLLLNRMFGVV
jgi:hypothetical protein